MGSPAIPDKNGKYPEQTSVRRYCDGLPKDSLAQGKTYAVCLTSEWKLSGLPECRFADCALDFDPFDWLGLAHAFISNKNTMANFY